MDFLSPRLFRPFSQHFDQVLQPAQSLDLRGVQDFAQMIVVVQSQNHRIAFLGRMDFFELVVMIKLEPMRPPFFELLPCLALSENAMGELAQIAGIRGWGQYLVRGIENCRPSPAVCIINEKVRHRLKFFPARAVSLDFAPLNTERSVTGARGCARGRVLSGAAVPGCNRCDLGAIAGCSPGQFRKARIDVVAVATGRAIYPL